MNLNGIRSNQKQYISILAGKPRDFNLTQKNDIKQPRDISNSYFNKSKIQQGYKQINFSHLTSTSPKISNMTRTSPSNQSTADIKDHQKSMSITQKNKSRCGSPVILSSHRSFIKPDHKIPKATLDLSQMQKQNKVKKPQRNIQITSRSKIVKISPQSNIIKQSSNSSLISNKMSIGNSQNFINEKNNQQRNQYKKDLKPKISQNIDSMKYNKSKETISRDKVSNNYGYNNKQRNQSNSGGLSSQKYKSQLSIRSSASVGNERISINRSNSKKNRIFESINNKYIQYKKNSSQIKSDVRDIEFQIGKNSLTRKTTNKTNKNNFNGQIQNFKTVRVSKSDLRQKIIKTSGSVETIGSRNTKLSKNIVNTQQVSNSQKDLNEKQDVLKRLNQIASKQQNSQQKLVKNSIKTSPRTNLIYQNSTKNFTVPISHSASTNIINNLHQKKAEYPLQNKIVTKKKVSEIKILQKNQKKNEFNQIIKKYSPQDIGPPNNKKHIEIKNHQSNEGKKIFNEIVNLVQNSTNNHKSAVIEKQIMDCIKKHSSQIDEQLNQKCFNLNNHQDSSHNDFVNIFEYLAQTGKFQVLLDYLLSTKCKTVVIYKNDQKSKNKNGLLNKNTALNLTCPQLQPAQLWELFKQQSDQASFKDLTDFSLLMKIKDNQPNEILMYRLNNIDKQNTQIQKNASNQEISSTQKIQKSQNQNAEQNNHQTQRMNQIETVNSSFSSDNNSEYEEVRQVEIDEFLCSQNTLQKATSSQNILRQQNTKTKLENNKGKVYSSNDLMRIPQGTQIIDTPQRCLKELNQSAQQAQQKESTRSRGGCELSQIEELPSPFEMRNMIQKNGMDLQKQSKLSNPGNSGVPSHDIIEQDKPDFSKLKSEKFDSHSEWKGSNKLQKSDGNHAQQVLSDANSSIKPPKQSQCSAKLIDKRKHKKEENLTSKNLGSQADQRGNEHIDRQDRHSGLGQDSFRSKILSLPGKQSLLNENIQNSNQTYANGPIVNKNLSEKQSQSQSQQNEKSSQQTKTQKSLQQFQNNQFVYQNSQNQNNEYESQEQFLQSMNGNQQQNQRKSSQKTGDKKLKNPLQDSSKVKQQSSNKEDFAQSSDFRPDSNYQTSRGQMLTVQTLNTIHQSKETKKESTTNKTYKANINSNQTEFDVQTPIKNGEKGETKYRHSITKTPNLVYENVSSLKQNIRKIQLSEDQESNGQNSRSDSHQSKRSQRPLKMANKKVVAGESFAYTNFMNECDFEEEKIQISLQPPKFNPQPSNFPTQKLDQKDPNSNKNSNYENDQLLIGPDSFIAHQLLGTGSFGEVFLVEEISTGKLMAMKVLSKAKIREQKLMKYAYTEKQIMAEMSAIDHPFIVKLYYTFQTKDHLYMIMQFCEGGDLSQYLELEGCFAESKARRYICEIMCAIEALHEKNIIFRDLKPDNICLDADGHAMLTDFGLSRMNIKNDTKGAESFCGSYAYLAPEMLKKKGHGKAVDWYLIGVVLYELLTGMPPYYDDDKDILFKNISNNQLEFPPSSESPLSDECKDLLIRLLEKDPNKRLGIQNGLQEIKSHKFFASVDWNKINQKQYSQPKAYLAEMAMQIIKKQPYALKDHPRTKGNLCLKESSDHFEDWEINMVQKFNVSKR